MLDLPTSPADPDGRVIIDTVGKAYLTNHTVTAHCWCGPRWRILDLLAIIEQHGHAWPLDRIKARCSDCHARATLSLSFVRWNVSGHLMPYPEPPSPGRSREAWQADYVAYRTRREAAAACPTPPAAEAGPAADPEGIEDPRRSA